MNSLIYDPLAPPLLPSLGGLSAGAILRETAAAAKDGWAGVLFRLVQQMTSQAEAG